MAVDNLDENADLPEPDQVPSSEPVEERETRGLIAIVLPTLLGAAAGAVIGALVLLRNLGGTVGMDVAAGQGAIEGGAIGALIGASGGVLVWVLFPYKGRTNQPAND